ncbi:hypothetical protein ACSBR2_027745 [Camellia fascicularis]
MSPTLDDVSVILGIPVIGKPVSCKKVSNVDAANLLVEVLGVIIDEANVALKVARGQSIKVESLRQRFGLVSDADNDNTIDCAARAYLLYLLGCTLFANKTGTCVPISRTQSGSSTSILQKLREDLDRLEVYDVIWDPYHDKRIEHPFSDVAYYSGCLKCMHIVKPYHPDRVLRQFGRVQIILSPPLAPVRASRGSTAK